MKRIPKLAPTLTAFVCLAVSVGCTQGDGQPVHYEKDGIGLTLPSQCKIAKDEYLDDQRRSRVIHIECPGNAVFSILCIPATSSKSLEQFAASIAEGRVSRFKEKFSVGGIDLAKATRGTSETSTATIQGSERAGIRQRYSISALGAIVPHVTEFYMLKTEQYKVVLMTQASDDKLGAARGRWRTIFDTLKLDHQLAVADQR